MLTPRQPTITMQTSFLFVSFDFCFNENSLPLTLKLVPVEAGIAELNRELACSIIFCKAWKQPEKGRRKSHLSFTSILKEKKNPWSNYFTTAEVSWNLVEMHSATKCSVNVSIFKIHHHQAIKSLGSDSPMFIFCEVTRPDLLADLGVERGTIVARVLWVNPGDTTSMYAWPNWCIVYARDFLIGTRCGSNSQTLRVWLNQNGCLKIQQCERSSSISCYHL